MPIIKSAKKRVIQTLKRETRRKPFKSRMLTMVKNVFKLIKGGKVEEAAQSLPDTYTAIDKANKKNIIHKNTAARKKSAVQKAVTAALKESGTTAPAKKAAPKAAAKKAPAKKAAPKSTAK
ncbi:30S ribosomal protein S20 [Candidatus Peregrinibacteria bacterium]|nr:MAG: 30S ribosomal protein S20 [Candidatus Peregrinibacteria bacterium]